MLVKVPLARLKHTKCAVKATEWRLKYFARLTINVERGTGNGERGTINVNVDVNQQSGTAINQGEAP